ncbi:hypothetical protein [Pseudomonas fontis]|uniref:Lipoprotein n=1 Tax=Pseudomonas fontis TaxID=2942633 RepID=A0ABT5NSV1_9PSED|nr:hypothetical protein [Pseudomonas fontis]MDD0975219.1 hypothetical protein [Pseudomonas fontis]MDD0991239.1 hypothetical protein [Pseudomonas fontis]
MSVFTVYFCGTGSHRFDHKNPNFWNGELVSTLASNDQGKEFANWVVIDGPGSGNLQADDLFVKTAAYGLTGTLFGTGWEENVAHALQMIKGRCDWRRIELSEAEYNRLKAAGVPIDDLEESGSWLWRRYNYGKRGITPQQLQEQIIKMFRRDGLIPTQVNLVGWSRGGISCHMLANAMFKDAQLRHVPVNIFAVDPVPGVLNLQEHRIQLEANVKEYVGFYSRDERSKGFACVIPALRGNARMHIYPLPGRHATLVGNASLDGAGAGKVLTQPGLIVRHFAECCLTRWGVKLDKRLQLTDRQLMDYHRELMRDDLRYQAMRSQSYTLLTEGDVAERFVHQGLRGTGFGQVKGNPLVPLTGLAVSSWDVTAYKHLR